jgi:hypothetical protein
MACSTPCMGCASHERDHKDADTHHHKRCECQYASQAVQLLAWGLVAVCFGGGSYVSVVLVMIVLCQAQLAACSLIGQGHWIHCRALTCLAEPDSLYFRHRCASRAYVYVVVCSRGIVFSLASQTCTGKPVLRMPRIGMARVVFLSCFPPLGCKLGAHTALNL